MKPTFLRSLGLVGVLLLVADVSGEDSAKVLLRFNHPDVMRNLIAQDATTALTNSGDGIALHVRTGHTQRWPGITIPAPRPSESWDLSSFARVEIRLRNVGTNGVTIRARVDNPGADGRNHCTSGSLWLEPASTGWLKVPLRRAGHDTMKGKLFGLRGYPVAWGGPGTVNPTNITQMLLFVSDPPADHAFAVEEIRATGSWIRPTAWTSDADPYFPLIDKFGQYRHQDWPGKVHSLTELRERRVTEEAELQARPGLKTWDRFGGWTAGPSLEATGYFRVEKVRGQWWLIDPDGHLFWSHGIDCVRMLDATVVEEREHWFEDFPGFEASFQEFNVPRSFALKGHYAGRSPRSFSFAGANLKQKYGTDWKQEVPAIIHRRLRSWGLNTIGNWSEEGVRLMRRTPYTDTLGSRPASMIEGSEGYWGKFPDVFDPSFRESLRRSMERKKNRSAGDPWCIGYFSDNEMAWGNDTSLALASLRSPASQAAKQTFVNDLRQCYGEIQALNATWGTDHDSWAALLASRDIPDEKKARADLTAFYTRLAETYFQTVREVIREVAPHQLYLGCRFAWVNDLAAAAAAKHCDVVSYNLYRREVGSFLFNGDADVPLIIGEFHFGALDRGLFHTGLVPVEDQPARANAYRAYVRGALHHPQFVGVHWFQYQDEPTTGRVYDEENYQIGFIDIADTPYAETIEASRDVAATLYDERWRP